MALLPGLVAVAILLSWRLGYFELARREHLLALVENARHSTWAELVYVAAFVAIATFGLPITVLTIVGGALFGVFWGAALAWVGAMLTTLAAYTLARSIGQKSVGRFLGRHHLLGRLKKHSDFWTLFRLRVLPVAPFATLDYLAGFLDVSHRALLLATAFGVLPTIALYSYAGARLVAGLEQTGAGFRTFWVVGSVTLVMIGISLIPAAIRKIRD